LSLYLMIG